MLACSGFGALVGLVAVVLGMVALSKLRSDTDTTGKGLAWGGIGTGAAAVVLGIVGGMFLLSALQAPREAARESARQVQASSNLRSLTSAAHMYASDHDAKLPHHPDDLQGYINRSYTLYYAPGSDQFGPPTVTVLAENERETFYRAGDVVFIGRKEGFGRLSSFMSIVSEPMFFTLYRPDTGRRSVSYLDGHVELKEEAEFREEFADRFPPAVLDEQP